MNQQVYPEVKYEKDNVISYQNANKYQIIIK